MSLPHDSRERLALLQRRFGTEFYAEVPDQVGVDDERRLEVVIDCACRLRDVRILGLDQLRRPHLLAAAVSSAFVDADSARAIASAQVSPHYADLAAEGAALVSGAVTLQVDPRSDAERQHARFEGGADQSDADRLDVDRTGRSSNGYLGVRLGADGAPLMLDVDELWLGAAQPDRLCTALLEAFEAADAAGGDHRNDGRI